MTKPNQPCRGGPPSRPQVAGKRSAFKSLAVGVVLLLGATWWARAQTPDRQQAPESAEPGASQAAATQPRHAPVNVVIFLIDTLRADRLGVYGYERRPTSPRIDALACEGVVFEQANAPTPWTLPTLVSLMTSTFLCEHGTVHDEWQMSDELEPLAARLKRLGYTTLDLFANSYAGPAFGLHRGFDYYQPSPQTDGERVAEALDRRPGTPFFLYIHNIEPHDPYSFAPEHTEGFRDIPKATRRKMWDHCRAYRIMTRADFTQKAPLGLTDNTKQQDRHMAALTELRDEYSELYDASVRLADSYVGSVIDVLQQRGLWDNTLFMVVSDHGEEMNEHGGWLHDQSVYEELVHVPLIMRFPRGQFAGRRVKSVVSLVDVLPTIFDYLQHPELASRTRGRSLMPLIRSEEQDVADELIVPAMRVNGKKYYRPWKVRRGDINIVVREGRWKGIWNVEPDTFELYDLSSDPAEQQDVSAANPARAMAMQLFARAWYEDCRKHKAAQPKRSKVPDEATQRNLRALGYVE